MITQMLQTESAFRATSKRLTTYTLFSKGKERLHFDASYWLALAEYFHRILPTQEFLVLD
jgi:hypothetical protein